MKKDEKEFYEEARESVQERRTESWSAALRKRLAGTGEEAGRQVRSALLLAARVGALGFWGLDDETEPELESVAPPTRTVSPTAQREEAVGAKAAQEGNALADPFSLLHGDEQATLAAMAAVRGDAAVNAAEKHVDEKAARAAESQKGAQTAGTTAGHTHDGRAAGGAAVPKVRGTVTSRVGTVLLISVSGRDVFLAEGEEKEGVLLQSLSEKSAVVIVGGRSYTLSLPG